ncbi:cytochrome P450 [Nocardia macrotermitis]|uniref:cytochrome P450 n=1 Tax=Nocardia macrotermitis TaxID=2585198 RepID=UPI0029E8173D|nr:cytochrome P450 [Nocardia macrotermitis]
MFDDDVAGDVRDPYPELAAARRAHPVQRLDTSNMPHADDAAVFFVYGYDDILEVLRDGRTYSSAHIIDMLMGDIMGKHIILGMDDPEHRRYRALVSTAFRQKALANWEERLIEPVADELIDRFADRGRADLVTEFTFPFPTLVTAGMLGLPREDLRRFQRWSIAILGFHTNRERAIVASQEVKEYLAEILAERRREPREDLISDLSRAELDGEKLSDEEIFSFLRLLLPAGIETTYRSTGNMLYSLLSRPDQLQALRENRALVPRAVEESIRYETPLLNITRMATTSTVLHDVPIPQGSTVMLMLAAANRDESRWHDPDDFDIFRAPRPHMSFGQGSHNCLGIHLARTEMRLALEKLLDKLPNLRLDPEADDPHIRGQVFRSPTALPVLFG